MTPWWIVFEDGTAACCEGVDARMAVNIAEAVSGKTVPREGGKWDPTFPTVARLPYPASPVLWQFTAPGYGSPCPPFCWRPRECVGKSACPQNRACSE